MFDAYNAQSKSIGDLLGESLKGRVVVPQFQRGYSWGKKHVEAFWQDIVRFRKEGAEKNGPDRYFLGPIVVMQPDDEKDTTYILDGQQRLATATILFSVLRDLASALNIKEAATFADDVQSHQITKEDYGYCLRMGASDRDYFEAVIQSATPDGKKKPKIRSQRNILTARDLLFNSIKATLPPDPNTALDVLRALRTTVRRDLIMASIPVRSQRDAFRIFETLNDRGLRLSVPDLLLNFLMGLAKDDDERTQIRKYWDAIIEGLGKKDSGVFFRHIWISKYGDLKNQDLYTALKQHIESKSIGSLDFAKTCAEECERYIELIKANKDALGKAAVPVDTLVNDLDFEVTLPLLMSAHTELSNAELEKVVRLVLVFVTRYTIFMGLDPSGLESAMYALAREIRGMPKDKVVSHVKNILSKKAPDDAQLIAIKSDDYGLILEPQDAVYVLSRIADRMQSNTKELGLKNSNLEHVFPKSPDASEWTNADDLEPYLWHLGNLTMLGKKLNGKVANAGYSKKRTYYEKNTELKITKQLAADYQTWDIAAIQKRSKQLMKLVAEIWDFNNPSRV